MEPASKLLERILKERRKKWEESQLAAFKRKGTTPKDDKWKEKYKHKEPVGGDPTVFKSIPDLWTISSPAILTSDDVYSLAIGPFGSNLKVSDYRESGIPLIFVRNIRSQNFKGKNTKYISEEKAQGLAAHFAYGGDVLITKMGAPPGDACLYPVAASKAVVTADCIKWSIDKEFIPQFYVLATNSKQLRHQIAQITKGVAQQKISLDRFKSLRYPVPPPAEQEAIVIEVERRLSGLDKLEQVLNEELKRSTNLRQSILKKAFEGKLVPQNPKDEPASELLKRIQADQEAGSSKIRVQKIRAKQKGALK